MFSEGTFPYDCHAPSYFVQQEEVLPIPLPVFLQFAFPPFPPCFRKGSPFTVMKMPKAAMNENGCPEFRQNDVGGSRKVSSVQAEPESFPEEGFLSKTSGFVSLERTRLIFRLRSSSERVSTAVQTARSRGRSLISFSRFPSIMVRISSEESSDPMRSIASFSSVSAK